MPVTTKVVNSNPVHGEVYSIQHCVIKFVSARFSLDPPASSTNKTDRQDIAEILLKVALNTIKPVLASRTLIQQKKDKYISTQSRK